MNDSKLARTAARSTRSTILIALAVVIAAIVGDLVYQSLAASSSLATHDARAQSIPAAIATVARQAGDVRRRPPPPPIDNLHGDDHGAPEEADGAVPDGVTVFDDEFPAVANLAADLLQALREAATDAADDGVTFYVNGGWRSPEYQNQLLGEAVSEKRKLPDGSPQLTRLLMCQGMRSTSGSSMPRSGCPNTAQSTGYARSIATSPGTTNCAPKPPMTVALPCTPTLPTIQECSSDQHDRHMPAHTRRSPTAHTAGDPRGDRQEHRDCTGADSFPDHGSGQNRWVRAPRHRRPQAAIAA